MAQAGDADVVFVGRSLESVYELLRGAFFGTEQQSRWSQLLVSLRGDSNLAIGSWTRVAPLVPYLRSLGLEPRQLVRRRRPLVFADLVSTGGTFEMLIALLRRIASEQGADWNVIRRVLNIDNGTARNVRSGYVLHWTARSRPFRERLVRAIARQAPHHSPYLSSLMHTLRRTART